MLRGPVQYIDPQRIHEFYVNSNKTSLAVPILIVKVLSLNNQLQTRKKKRNTTLFRVCLELIAYYKLRRKPWRNLTRLTSASQCGLLWINHPLLGTPLVAHLCLE